MHIHAITNSAFDATHELRSGIIIVTTIKPKQCDVLVAGIRTNKLDIAQLILPMTCVPSRHFKEKAQFDTSAANVYTNLKLDQLSNMHAACLKSTAMALQHAKGH